MNENTFSNLLAHEGTARLLCFLAPFALLAFLEIKFTRRTQKIPKDIRWPGNLGLMLINTIVIRILFPGSALLAARWSAYHEFGLFHWVEVPFLFSFVFTLIFLDMIVYYQHRAFHAFPWLWKMHRVHHADLEVDVTTGIRFHALEMVISMLLKSAAIILLGAPLAGVFLFEVLLNATSLFSHSNLGIPLGLDRFLRFTLVTPDMHRIHHSALPKETNSNFGFNLVWWDRLLGTYRTEPEKGQEKLRIGLDVFDEPKYLRLDRLLLQPFLDGKGNFSFRNLTRKD
jgi:sterol desaturase/sphingolipid hydroxylase (fatty acid hydroxylase superfamily)